MPQAVYIAGVGRTDFKRNLAKEGTTLASIIAQAALDAIADARIQPADIRAGIVGNFAAGLFTRQLHLGAMLAAVHPALRGIPTLHTEAACASGGVAVLTAAQLIAGGIHDAVLVVGAEQQKTMPVMEGADVLGAAGDFRAERPKYGTPLFPQLFGEIARRYARVHGLSPRALAHIAAKNYAAARLNPHAQLRDRAPLSIDQAQAVSEANPLIADPLRLTDCSQITDGAAAVVLVSDAVRARLASPRAVRLAGYGHTTDHLALDDKDVPAFPHARRAADAAYAMARITPRDLDAAEIHDCFSITELLAYEAMGLAAPGEAPLLAESGATMLPSVRQSLGLPKPPGNPIPVNPGGGLIADGHPVGATGVRQVVEAATQLRHEAGPRQVDPARTLATFNMGGTLTTSVAMIWTRPDHD